MEHETGLAGGLRLLCASRAKLGREPAKHATVSAANPFGAQPTEEELKALEALGYVEESG
jgi:hypothetical protein